MASNEREQLWKQHVAQWQASGLSQRAYAVEQGIPLSQLNYWIRRFAKSQVVPALLPVRLEGTIPSTATVSLRNEHGWTLTLPGDVPAVWLAELMRAL